MAGEGTRGWSRKAFSIPPRPCTEIGRPLIDSFLGRTLPCPTGSAFSWARTTKSNLNTSNVTWPNSITGSTAALWRPIVSAPGAGLSHNQHCHLQGVNRRAGSSLIFIKINFQHLLPDLALQLCHPIRLRPLVSRAHKGACPQLLLFVIPAVHLARTYLQLPCQPRHWLPRLHAPHRRQLKFPGKPPFRHTNPPSLNSIGELVVSKLGSTSYSGVIYCSRHRPLH